MDDRQAESGLPPGELKESLPESHEAKLEMTEATNADSTQTLTTPSNGSSSPRKIEANRRNAKNRRGRKHWWARR